ncbi:efflux RND transporter permease subunit [Rhizobium mongolense]|uniref:HAE1 family hydrophobic/amphiphilic exporter-1 n=2 Tax=Rhizobium mongolense TaxID=57676 RepID=A0ABR6IZF6_9HYPH|nr:efflux RND transporter permease subunit [Rhizobium mongolense]MBB4233266.1 HAE1 family hydrophobic/amphiphilic exporter-1 [Rhizobium mongolense]TVZ75289.1 nodulation-related efflux transporter NolG [Rhizobium mongolense USDA 1844]
MFLTRISVNHPVFATMMMVTILVLGLFSYGRLGVDHYPETDLPIVVVETTYTGASPVSVESEISRPIESALNAIGGIDSITSESYEGRSVVVVEFELDVDSQVAAQEVRDRVARLEATFPDGVDTPQVTRFKPDGQAILSVAASSSIRTLREITTLANRVITNRLSVISGVGQISLVGGSERQVLVVVDPDRLEAYGVGVSTVMDAIRRENQDRAAGTLISGINQRIVTVEGRIADASGFNSIIIANSGGYPVYLSDVATVLDTGAEVTSLANYQSMTTVGLRIVKVQGANTVEVASALRREISALNAELAKENVRLTITRDNSRPIASQVFEVQRTLIEGGVLAVLIVFVFLNSWRSTVITGLTLPISVIGTFATIYALGFTLNIMTLMALSLSIGILIDDAIVVRENITRHLQMGKDHVRAALDGTNEIGLAVLSTTLCIVAVFLPVAFMGGLIGRFFLQFGVTVAVAVVISLFVSFTLDPMLSSVWYDPQSQKSAKRGFFGRMIERFDQWFESLASRYRSVIHWSFDHRKTTIAIVVAMFVASLLLVPRIGTEFLPPADQGEVSISLEANEGASLDYMAAKVGQVERVLRDFDYISSTYSTINSGELRGFNQAIVAVQLVPSDQRRLTTAETINPIRQRLATIAGLEISVGQPSGPGGSLKPLQLSVLGDGDEELRRISDHITSALAAIPGAIEIESSIENVQPTLAVRVRREAASDLGVSIATIGDTLKPLVAGDAISVWNAPDGEPHDVVVRLPPTARRDAAQLRNLIISTGRTDDNGKPITVLLDQVADVVESTAPDVITRKDLSREVRISSHIDGRASGDVAADLNAAIAKMDIPLGFRISFGGDAENLAESTAYAFQSLVLAVIFIYIILASQFSSFIQPIAIIMTLPLSLIGVLLGLLFTGSTLNMFSMIGFIMLMGLVTKNAILLVDYSNRGVREGKSLRQSLADAGAARLRPIVMTTLAMIFGMLPTALGLGEGGAQRAPMAHAVIGGLISSTLLSLVFVPVILTYLNDIARRLKRWLTHPTETNAAAQHLDFDKGKSPISSVPSDHTATTRMGRQFETESK